LLYWNRTMSAGTQLYKLGRSYMEPFKTTTDSFLVVDKTSPGTWFAVAPVLPYNKQGIRSVSFDYTAQGVGCYIKNFTADLFNGSGKLALSFGSLYEVAHISIEKMTADGRYQLWKQANAPFALQYQFTDSSLARGATYYRARIDLQNGNIIYSDVETIYFTGTNNYFLYPNPVHRPNQITLLSTQAGVATIQFFNVYGQKITEKKLSNLVEQLGTASIAKGIYFYMITEGGKKVSSGKLIVQ